MANAEHNEQRKMARTKMFVTYPFSTVPGTLNQEFVGRVVRIDELADGRRGIAVELLMPLQVSAYEPIR